MKRLAIMTVTLAALIHTYSACAETAKDSGKSLFRENCVLCHGTDGTGKTPAGTAFGAHDLSSPAMGKKADAELEQTIHSGRDKMPAFGKKLSEIEIHELVEYVRTLKRN
jgi:cytochrome c6